MASIRAVLAVVSTFVAGSVATDAGAATLSALSAQDAQLYASAFQAAERGDVQTVDSTLAQIKDPCLVGRVEYVKLTGPSARTTSYDDLVRWLTAFKDLPGADKVYALAMKLKPRGAEPPAPAASVLVDGEGARGRASTQSKAAREAYFDGDLNRALTLAKSSGDVWFAGLAAYRLGAYDQAVGFFEAVARNAGEADAARAGGAFWASRAAEAAGMADRAGALLRTAAGWPGTFYGMIAARKLELNDDPLGRAIEAAIEPSGEAQQPVTHIDASGLQAPAVLRLIRTDARARRAVALMQVGRPVDAGLELRTGLAMANGAEERNAWTTLVVALNPNRNGPAQVVVRAPAAQGAVYPTPPLKPLGGYSVSKALVYAVTWQESRFNSLAVSPVGALGLMQVMPATAAGAVGDDTLKADPLPLFDPGTNLQIGQQYLTYLLGRMTGGDLLRVVAAYNGGEAVVNRTEAALGPDADSLLLIESLPFYETRAYVQKVVGAYWSYRRQFGQPAATLDAAASGARIIQARLDR